MEETTFEKIVRVTGAKSSACSCDRCRDQCKSPCLGTPEDIEKLVLAGYQDRLARTIWLAGKVMGITDKGVELIAPWVDKETGFCTFYKDGWCELHEKDLKPTEGRLSSHRTRIVNDRNQVLSWAVAKEWIDPEYRDKV